jgi:hypothetical protein
MQAMFLGGVMQATGNRPPGTLPQKGTWMAALAQVCITDAYPQGRCARHHAKGARLNLQACLHRELAQIHRRPRPDMRDHFARTQIPEHRRFLQR